MLLLELAVWTLALPPVICVVRALRHELLRLIRRAAQSPHVFDAAAARRWPSCLPLAVLLGIQVPHGRPLRRVVEPVGLDHDEECPPACPQRHAFHYVRVPASRSTAAPQRRQGRRLDLVVDLREELRWGHPCGRRGGRTRPSLAGLAGRRYRDAKPPRWQAWQCGWSAQA